MITLDKIYHAAFVLKEVARRTDLIHATNLMKDVELYLKTENLQVTGSFKLRGAYYKISQLTEEEFRAHCKEVIDNSGSLSDTYRQIDEILKKAGLKNEIV